MRLRESLLSNAGFTQRFYGMIRAAIRLDDVMHINYTGLFIRSDAWVGLTWILFFHCLPSSAWANGNLADVAGQLGKMVEQSDQSHPNPCI